MSLLKLLQEQTVENHGKTSIRETGEPHHYARGADISGICFRRIDPKSYALPRLDPINRKSTDAPPELTRTPPTVPPHLFPEDGTASSRNLSGRQPCQGRRDPRPGALSRLE